MHYRCLCSNSAYDICLGIRTCDVIYGVCFTLKYFAIVLKIPANIHISRVDVQIYTVMETQKHNPTKT